MFFPSFHTTFKVVRVYIIHDQGLFFFFFLFSFLKEMNQEREKNEEREEESKNLN